jgi:hypothetical protein
LAWNWRFSCLCLPSFLTAWASLRASLVHGTKGPFIATWTWTVGLAAPQLCRSSWEKMGRMRAYPGLTWISFPKKASPYPRPCTHRRLGPEHGKRTATMSPSQRTLLQRDPRWDSTLSCLWMEMVRRQFL